MSQCLLNFKIVQWLFTFHRGHNFRTWNFRFIKITHPMYIVHWRFFFFTIHVHALQFNDHDHKIISFTISFFFFLIRLLLTKFSFYEWINHSKNARLYDGLLFRFYRGKFEWKTRIFAIELFEKNETAQSLLYSLINWFERKEQTTEWWKKNKRNTSVKCEVYE